MQGCYSPASSMISTATIRSNNIKESKEKKNREKLLAGPGSEFSLSNHEDMELDYYDYNVTNAGAAPGSYLGMDPAYLVWIPPIDDGRAMTEEDTEESDDEDEDDDDDDYEDDDEENDDVDVNGDSAKVPANVDEPHYEEILPAYTHLSPGSNTETPDRDVAPSLPPANGSSIRKMDDCDEKSRNLHNLELNKPRAVSAFNNDIQMTKMSTLKDAIQMRDLFTGKNSNSHKNNSHNSSNVSSSSGSQQWYAATSLSPLKMPGRSSVVYRDNKDEETEKETAVIKSMTEDGNNGRDYYELDDIQFADEGDDDVDDDETTNALAAHRDTNRLKAKQMQQQQQAKRPVTLIALTTNRK